MVRILFLDFYKAFDIINHQYFQKGLKAFVLANKLTQTVNMFYTGINS